MKYLLPFTFLVCFGASIQALKLPSYLQACSRSDPNLNQCALEQGRSAKASILKGDPKYHIPNMLPLKIPQIVIGGNQALKIVLNDVTILGLEDAEIKGINIDLPNNKASVDLFFPTFSCLNTYDIKGRILVLPIQGSGPANFSCINTDVTYSLIWEKILKKGKEHYKITDHSLTYNTKRAWFHLENLFNGDKRLGDEMNKLLDANWQEVLKDVGPAISETISTIITTIITELLDRVPADDFFAP